MKLNSVSYTRPSRNLNNTENNLNANKKNPAFRGNLGAGFVGLASFIENNGFLGEFLTIDTVGMMMPRTIQGYARNSDELGHPNYKAGREELVRELLSGPAYFYVPLAVLTLAGVLRGKTAKVDTRVLDGFKGLMKNTAVEMKNAAETKRNFVGTVIKDAFKGYTKHTNLVDEISELMNKTVTNKLSFADKVSNLFKSKADKKVTPAMLRKQAAAVVTKLNKANGKFLDHADMVEVGGQKLSISNLFKDMSNYLDDFTNKAARTGHDTETFIDKFHKKAKDLRNATNILAVSALSAFLMIIPKLYQTDKNFPGKDGLTTGEETTTDSNAQTPASNDEKNVKEAV